MHFFPKRQSIIVDTYSRPLSEMDNNYVVEEIKSFFLEVKKEQVETIFSSILETCLTAEDPVFETAEARFELLTMLKKIKCLIEAASQL